MSDPPVATEVGLLFGVLVDLADDRDKGAPLLNFRLARHRMSVRACQSTGGIQDRGMEVLMTSKMREMTSTPCLYTASRQTTSNCLRIW